MFSRSFGVEIECVAPAGVDMVRAASLITAAGVECRALGYTHATLPTWKIVSDGSVVAVRGGQGMEIVSPPLSGEQGFAQVAAVCRALCDAGFTVNRSCGLHVHVDARSLGTGGMKALAAIYAGSEAVIDSCLPASRRANNNQYCRSVAGVDLDRLNRASQLTQVADVVSNGGRYVKLNLTAFWRHGTVEFRHHSGTTEATKVCMWVKACLRMVAAAARIAPTQTTPSAAPQRTRTLRTFVEMASRPQGVSRDELGAALGWQSARSFSLTQAARRAGVALRSERGRHFVAAAQQAVANAVAAVAVRSVAEFAALLGMDAAEQSYWNERAADLAA